MKFTVKNLLAVTLLAALAINGGNTRNQSQQLTEQKSKLTSQVRRLTAQAFSFDEKKLILDRAFEATKKREREFENCYLEFEEYAKQSSQIKLDDPSKIYFVAIPTLKPESGCSDRIRIWLPDSHQYHLQLSFQQYSKNAQGPSPSKFFNAKKNIECPITAGESVIEIKWIEGSTRSEIQLLVNNELALTAEANCVLSSESKFGPALLSTVTSKNVESAYLLGGSYKPKQKADVIAETFLLRVVVSANNTSGQSE